jgi:hypothetical protein
LLKEAVIVLWGIWLEMRVREKDRSGRVSWVFEGAWNGAPQRVRVP